MLTYIIIACVVLFLAGLAAGSPSARGQGVTVMVGPSGGAQAGGMGIALAFLILLFGALLFVLLLVMPGIPAM